MNLSPSRFGKNNFVFEVDGAVSVATVMLFFFWGTSFPKNISLFLFSNQLIIDVDTR